jgi:hypothetical protein
MQPTIADCCCAESICASHSRLTLSLHLHTSICHH